MRIVASFALLLAVIGPAPGADISPPDLYAGWLQMYDLRFDQAHTVFAQWQQAHSADPLGPASDAAACLFSELARLGVLESELFTADAQYQNRAKLHPDPQIKAKFDSEISRADRLADAKLQAAPADADALFAKALTFGLRADLASLIDKQDVTAVRYIKQGRPFAERLIAIDPKAYDAYLGLGIENYLLSLKSAPLRAYLWLTGSQVDRDKGLKELQLTAQHGHYLEPFAKLLLAVAAVRDNKRAEARSILSELHNRFPGNPLYVRELDRLTPKLK